eukprot:Anaeramoba_ignava/c20007_g1_i2.p1 GENE.c20007_g1_i2~~c20007_g1_i2.p1  ORF type:complete len:521 (+),score=181.72 c20007_g1_i2:82-1644(+)
MSKVIHKNKLKQVNKKNKARFRTKGEIKKKNKGRKNKDIITQSNQTRIKETKESRKNARHQIRKNQREKTIQEKRKLGVLGSPPKILGLIPLDNMANTKILSELIQIYCNETTNTLESPVTVYSGKYKQNFTIIEAKRTLSSILEVGKTSDIIVFVCDGGEAIDNFGNHSISALHAQGLPSFVSVVQNISKFPSKDQQTTKNFQIKHIQSHFAQEVKVSNIEHFELEQFIANSSLDEHQKYNPKDLIDWIQNKSGIDAFLRRISSMKIKSLNWKEIRPYLLVDNIDFQNYSSNEFGTLLVSGYLRGKSLDVNGLIHVPDFGDYQMEKIEIFNDPLLSKQKNHEKQQEKQNQEDIQSTLFPDPSLQESLESEKEQDFMMNEQTWPTEEEIKSAEAPIVDLTDNISNQFKQLSVQFVPSSVDKENQDFLDSQSNDIKDEEFESLLESFDINENFEFEQNTKKPVLLEERAKEDMEFPDEIDTPLTQPARIRFQKYSNIIFFNSFFSIHFFQFIFFNSFIFIF